MTLDQTLLQNNNEETLWFTGNVFNFGGMVLQTNKELIDKNGNILSLKRYARNDDECFLFDDLAYYYDYNRLKAVDDMISGQNDLGDYHDNGLYYSQHEKAEFYYDENGNLAKDMNRNIGIRYGIMHNLPIYISYQQIGGGGSIATIDISAAADKTSQTTSTSYSGSMMNHYTMHGRKLAKKVYNDQHTLTLNESYFDELMLSHRQPSRISHADGYVSLDENGDASFYYYLKDHLGNVRSVLTPDTDGKPQVEQANDYFPFGMSFESRLLLLSLWKNGKDSIFELCIDIIDPALGKLFHKNWFILLFFYRFFYHPDFFYNPKSL